jgi:hypothetical protein
MAANKATPPTAIPAIAPVERVDPDDELGAGADIPVWVEVKVVEDKVAEPVGEPAGKDDDMEEVEVGGGSCSQVSN